MKPSTIEATKNTQEHLLKEPQAGSSRRLFNPWHRSTLSPQVEPPHTLSIPIRTGIPKVGISSTYIQGITLNRLMFNLTLRYPLVSRFTPSLPI